MTPLFYIVAPSITGRVRSLARCLLHDDEQRIPAIPAAALAGPWTSAITCKAGQVIIKERTQLTMDVRWGCGALAIVFLCFDTSDYPFETTFHG